MNVVILLLTSVSAGADPVMIAPAAPAAPVASSSCGGSCGAVSDCCTSCCEVSCCKEKRSRSRKKDCCCEVVSCAPACCAPAACPSSCCGATSCCQPSCCEPVCCEKPKRRSLFSRKKKDCCCEVITCDSCSSCGTAVAAPAPHGIVAPAAPAHGAIINPAPIQGTPLPQGLPGKAAEPIKKLPTETNKGVQLMPMSLKPANAKVETEAKNPF